MDSTKRILEKVSYKRTGGKDVLFLPPSFSSFRAYVFVAWTSLQPRRDSSANALRKDPNRKNPDL